MHGQNDNKKNIRGIQKFGFKMEMGWPRKFQYRFLRTKECRKNSYKIRTKL